MPTVVPQTVNWFTYFGADDEQIPMADAQALFDAVGSADKTFRVFTTDQGGSQHCQRDDLTLGNTAIFDWLAEKL